MYNDIVFGPDGSCCGVTSLIKTTNAAKVPRSPHLNTHKLNKYLGWIIAKSVPRVYFCLRDIKTLCLVAKTIKQFHLKKNVQCNVLLDFNFTDRH